MRALEGELLPGRREDRAPPLAVDVDLVRLPRAVECRTALHAKRNRAADRLGEPNHLSGWLLRLAACFAADRHEVDRLRHPLIGEKSRDQDIRIGEVELADRALDGRRHRPEPALSIVEDRREDAGRIESRQAAPVDRAIFPY